MNERGGAMLPGVYRKLFIAVYLVVQLTVPAVGLYLAHQAEAPMRFSWHMFSRVRDGLADD